MPLWTESGSSVWGAHALRKLICSAVLAACLPIAAAAQGTVTVFGGYTYLRAARDTGTQPCPSFGCSSPTGSFNLNGWDASLEGKSFLWLGWVADISQQYGSPGGIKEKQTSALFGPQINIPHIPRAVPFVHALFGVVHGTNNTFINAPTEPCPTSGCPAGAFGISRGNAFATAVGGGVDIKLRGPIYLRAIQVDYLHADLSPDHHDQVRIAAGVAFHF
jgi:hypothetical protein